MAKRRRSIPHDVRIQVDPEDAFLLDKYTWCVSRRGYTNYAVTRITNGDKPSKLAYLHRYIMNPAKGLVVDHINGDGLDCRKSNMRNVTQTQNKRNRRKTLAQGVSGQRGIAYVPRNTKRPWVVQMPGGSSGKKYLGSYADEVFARCLASTWEEVILCPRPRV